MIFIHFFSAFFRLSVIFLAFSPAFHRQKIRAPSSAEVLAAPRAGAGAERLSTAARGGEAGGGGRCELPVIEMGLEVVDSGQQWIIVGIILGYSWIFYPVVRR